ncbi:MAG TPA: hypothetical protein VF142_06820 [Longimicrobium sp.]
MPAYASVHMVYPADDTVLRLSLLAREVRRLADSLKDATSHAREETSSRDEAAYGASAAAAPEDPLAGVRRAAAAASRRLPDAT